MYAVVKTGGKQYRVTPGDVILVEKLLGEAGGNIKLEDVLMVGEDGKAPEIGAPTVAKAAVNCEILDQSRADKVIVFKKKKRKGYRRLNGHRQEQTVLRVLDINGKGAVKPKTPAKAEAVDKPKSAAEPKSAAKAKAPAKAKAAAKPKAVAKSKAAAKPKAPSKKDD